MSGRQHHYLPQFLQRPFAYRRSGKESYVHAHHRCRGTYSPNTKGLGQELDFYGGPEDTTVDDTITKGENALASTLHAICQGREVPAIEAATLVAALGFRTKSSREALIEIFPALIGALRLRFGDRARLREELMASLSDPNANRRVMDEEIAKKMGHLPREQRAKAAAMMRMVWRPYVAQEGAKIVGEVMNAVHAFFVQAHSQATAVGNRAYLGALAKNPHLPARAERLASDLNFSVMEAGAADEFILGDCGPVAQLSNSRAGLVLGSFAENVHVQSVYLPVSPTRCLVGRPSSPETTLSVAQINRISAQLSLEFFISFRRDGDDLVELRRAIGTLSPVDSPETIIQSLLETR